MKETKNAMAGLKPFLANIKISNENNTPLGMQEGLPDEVDFKGFGNVIVKSCLFPGKEVVANDRMAIIQEVIQENVTVVYATYSTTVERVINIRSKEPGLFLVCILRGDLHIEWGSLEKEALLSGFFNLIYAPKNNQRLFLKPGRTEILEFHFTAEKLAEAIEQYNGDLTQFNQLMAEEKMAKFHPLAIYGEAKQFFFLFYLIHTLKSDKDDLDFNESMSRMATEFTFEQLFEPAINKFNYEQVAEFGRVMLDMHQKITAKNVWQNEVKQSFLTAAQFKNMFMQIWQLTPDGYIRDIKLSLAKKMLTHGIDLQLIVDKLGYASTEDFKADFKKFHGEDVSEFKDKFDGATW